MSLVIVPQAQPCGICADFTPATKVANTRLSCNHVYHLECIKKWFDCLKHLELPRSCPRCWKASRIVDLSPEGFTCRPSPPSVSAKDIRLMARVLRSDDFISLSRGLPDSALRLLGVSPSSVRSEALSRLNALIDSASRILTTSDSLLSHTDTCSNTQPLSCENV